MSKPAIRAAGPDAHQPGDPFFRTAIEMSERPVSRSPISVRVYWQRQAAYRALERLAAGFAVPELAAWSAVRRAPAPRSGAGYPPAAGYATASWYFPTVPRPGSTPEWRPPARPYPGWSYRRPGRSPAWYGSPAGWPGSVG